MTEKDLELNIKNLQNGSQEAFSAIYDAYSGPLFGLCNKILNDSNAAEDVLQESFVKIWKNANKFRKGKGSFYTWMLNITRNTAVDRYRKVKKNPTDEIQNHEAYVSNVKGQQLNIDKIGIQDLLSGLPDEQQVIIEYLYYKGYTQQETADELEMPLGTVKSRSRTALKALKELFTILLTWI